MTAVSFANEPLDSSSPVGTHSPMELTAKSSNARFNIRKRNVDSDNDKMSLSSYNSAFLSGLFADVAKASTIQEEDARLDPNLSIKRSRTSLTKSVPRSGRSCKNLMSIASAVGAHMFSSERVIHSKTLPGLDPSCCSTVERIDSLQFQLNCVSSNPHLPSVSPRGVKEIVDLKNRVIDIIDLAFPHLPATISESSCEKQDLTPKSDRQVSDYEKTPTETYGWFVDLDDGNDDGDFDKVDAYARSASSDLAFSAPTAPKRVSNYEAEVEWAKAADTVDDVLGDFF